MCTNNFEGRCANGCYCEPEKESEKVVVKKVHKKTLFSDEVLADAERMELDHVDIGACYASSWKIY